MIMDYPVALVINEVGKDLTLRKITEGDYNPATGSVVNTPADTTVKGMLLNYRDSQVDGSIIQQGDRRAVIRTGDAVPEIQDILIEGSTQYRIIDVRTVEYSGNAVIYSCQVRL